MTTGPNPNQASWQQPPWGPPPYGGGYPQPVPFPPPPIWERDTPRTFGILSIVLGLFPIVCLAALPLGIIGLTQAISDKRRREYYGMPYPVAQKAITLNTIGLCLFGLMLLISVIIF